ncbi:hypothetical protein ACHAWF_015776 [Thalassiosira exigua]
MAGSVRSKQKHAKSTAEKGTSPADKSKKETEHAGFFQRLRSTMGTNNVDDMTVWEVLTRHPLIRVGKFVAAPYLLYLGWFYFQLQHPEYLSKMTGGLIQLRPAVYGTDTPRQVLIVATPGSGTVQVMTPDFTPTHQMTSTLRSQLSLEIGHETSDAAWAFTRDGTISWFHGIRFLQEPKESKDRLESFTKICNSDIETHSNMGFHPAMYGPPQNKCSYRSKWDDCWKRECFVSLFKEWGCGIAKNCGIKFAKNVHQVRNPMNTLESLVVKYCVGGIDGTVADPFLTYASALFPSHDFSEDSCIEATGTFMVMYLEAMMKARLRGDIDSFYRIEDSSACDVAKAAGLLSDNEFELSTVVYEPNNLRINSICNNYNATARKAVEQKLNKVNKNQVQLGWKDLWGGMHGSKRKDGDRALEGRVKNMFAAFKYDESTVPLEYKKPSPDHSDL